MPTPQYHDTLDIVIAATLWPMHRYRQTGCNELSCKVEQHLSWLESRANSRQLAAPCQPLSVTQEFSGIAWHRRSSATAYVINCTRRASGS